MSGWTEEHEASRHRRVYPTGAHEVVGDLRRGSKTVINVYLYGPGGPM
jgi:hypothetical protein